VAQITTNVISAMGRIGSGQWRELGPCVGWGWVRD